MAHIRVAVVGTGGIARQHGLALANNPDATIVAAVDIDRERREQFAARWGGEPLDRLAPALDRVDGKYSVYRCGTGWTQPDRCAKK